MGNGRLHQRFTTSLGALLVPFLVFGSALVVTSAAVALGATDAAAMTTRSSPHVSSSPLIGIDVVPTNDYTLDRSDGVGAVMIQAGWNDAEPANGTFSSAYGASLAAQAAQAEAAGLKVVLDPGIQYPPSWVFLINKSSRFVDQYGDQFTGAVGSGEDVVNAVTDPQVRTALGHYLSWLGTQFPTGSLAAVREGGGPTGELRYPSGQYAGHSDAWWAYDPDSQAMSKVPGWIPGTGTAAQAQTFVTQYDSNLATYGVWLDGALKADFGTGMQKYLMLPSWGDRPGELATAEQNLLENVGDEAHMGLDWASLFPLIPDPQHTTLYSTWADAPSYGSTPTGEDPIDFIASLNTGGKFTLGGENTGGDDLAQMDLMAARVTSLHFSAAFWFSGTTFADGTSTDPTLEQWIQQT
jgi:hypothetical protein